MGEHINKEYEEFQKYLDKKEKKIKLLVKFDLNEDIDKVLELTSYTEPILSENMDDVRHGGSFFFFFVQTKLLILGLVCLHPRII